MLYEVITSDTRSRLAAKIIENFLCEYPSLSEKKFMSEYRRRSFLIGRTVTFPYKNELASGMVEDVDDDARLLVRLADQTRITSYNVCYTKLLRHPALE